MEIRDVISCLFLVDSSTRNFYISPRPQKKKHAFDAQMKIVQPLSPNVRCHPRNHGVVLEVNELIILVSQELGSGFNVTICDHFII